MGARRGREVEKLIELLEASIGREEGVEVKSPDYIPDRDTGRPREVDVAVRIKSGTHKLLVILECRDRATVEDVRWIEELATKRHSVGADKAVAVSTAGFSRPAQSKAKACMVELRTLEQFSGISAQSLLKGFPITVSLHDVVGAKLKLHVSPADDTNEYPDLESVKARKGTRPLFEGKLRLTDRVFIPADGGAPKSVRDLLGSPPAVEDVLSAKADGEWVTTQAVYGLPGDILFMDSLHGRKRVLAVEGAVQIRIREQTVIPNTLHLYRNEGGSLAGAAMYAFDAGADELKFQAVFGPG